MYLIITLVLDTYQVLLCITTIFFSPKWQKLHAGAQSSYRAIKELCHKLNTKPSTLSQLLTNPCDFSQIVLYFLSTVTQMQLSSQKQTDSFHTEGIQINLRCHQQLSLISITFNISYSCVLSHQCNQATTNVSLHDNGKLPPLCGDKLRKTYKY